MKRALLVGINKYQQPGSNLSGCLNDVAFMQTHINKYGFKEMQTLLNSQATKNNILDTLTTLIDNSEAGDKILYYHSGHGTRVVDTSGDESDSLDECLVAYDHDWDAPLSDDLMEKAINGLHPKARLYLIIDTCHSGTITTIMPGSKIKSIPMPPEMQKYALKKELKLKRDADPRKLNHILLSGCKPNEYSYEIAINNKIRGLMTWAFIETTQQSKSWEKTIKDVKKHVATQQPGQHPLLAGKPALRKEIIFK